jgi:hypothetical protein
MWVPGRRRHTFLGIFLGSIFLWSPPLLGRLYTCLANWTLVEQHKDDTYRADIYIVSTKPFPIKASDKGKPDSANKISSNKIPPIEVKNAGSLSFGWNSIHQGGYRYEFANGAEKPSVCDEFPQHIDSICKKYGLQYLDVNGSAIGDIPIGELFKADTIIYEGNNRHKEQLRINDSLIARNRAIWPIGQIKRHAMEWNRAHCDQSARFILKNNNENGKGEVGINETVRPSKNTDAEAPKIIKEASEAIMKKHRLLTIEETKEIRLYRNGVYVPGGDILIEKQAEANGY